MNIILKEILLNESSLNVVILHKTLRALGARVAPEEVRQQKAGRNTRQIVRNLQKKLNVDFDESMLVDHPTVVALSNLLKERGLLQSRNTFVVEGTVYDGAGSISKRQPLVVFDLDLKGVAIYRTVETLGDIRKNGGFEFLGEAVSNSSGRYEHTFYDWLYRNAERKKADVVVYAVEGGGIIGRSRLVNSEEYSDRGLVSDLDVLLSVKDSRTEYKTVMATLNSFFKESGTDLNTVAKSLDQLSFTAKELDLGFYCVDIAAKAQLLVTGTNDQLSHELFYGIGRQDVSLTWTALYKRKKKELAAKITASITARIIKKYKKQEISRFLDLLLRTAANSVLYTQDSVNGITLDTVLSNALPDNKQRTAFVRAASSFTGNDPSSFWNEYLPGQPEFREKPELVDNLLLTQQLLMFTGNHHALVHELQVKRGIKKAADLAGLSDEEWGEILDVTGAPKMVDGANEVQRKAKYRTILQTATNVTFPNRKVSSMIETKQIGMNNPVVSKAITRFLNTSEKFDLGSSRIHDFENELKKEAGDNYRDTRDELLKIQRVYQVSTAPDTMSSLMKANFHSARSIAAIPRKSFVNQYSNMLGGESTAHAVHQRASHINARSEMMAMRMMEYAHGFAPGAVLGRVGWRDSLHTIENHIPNYSELFGQPTSCECGHCSSVYSPAAYFVDILRYLDGSKPNKKKKTPLDLLAQRRPDLLDLQLTCENSNTLIPYIDIVNEILEYYVVHESLRDFSENTDDDISAEELRASPQNTRMAAYQILADSTSGQDVVYPFSLPYNHPLEVIRAYSGKLGFSRYDVMKALHPAPDAQAQKALAAESLALAEENYAIITGERFDATPSFLSAHTLYGYSSAAEMAGLSDVPEFLLRTGISYIDLVALLKTRFCNPHQRSLALIESIFSHSTSSAAKVYERLNRIYLGSVTPSDRMKIETALELYSEAAGGTITYQEFSTWVVENFEGFSRVLTLHEPESRCDLKSTSIRSIGRLYGGATDDALFLESCESIHKFIRLWRKLGWTIEQTDRAIEAVTPGEISAETITRLEYLVRLSDDLQLPVETLSVFWTSIDTNLYTRLFLNKAMQPIDDVFLLDEWGECLHHRSESSLVADSPPTLADHLPALAAPFGISERELVDILAASRVIERGVIRSMTLEDELTVSNLSNIYRHVTLAKALGLTVSELTILLSIADDYPFAIRDLSNGLYTNVSPEESSRFVAFAHSLFKAGFTPVDILYTLLGESPPDSGPALDYREVYRAAKSINDTLAVVEQDHPEMPRVQLSRDKVGAKLAVTYQSENVQRLLDIVEGTVEFAVITEDNLEITIPEQYRNTLIYNRGLGRLSFSGIMTETQCREMKDEISGITPALEEALDELYDLPEFYLETHFSMIFDSLEEAKEILLGRPESAEMVYFNEKLEFLYTQFIPRLKKELRKQAISRQVSGLIGLDERSTGLLLAEETRYDPDSPMASIHSKGFSATYFDDPDLSSPAFEHTEDCIDTRSLDRLETGLPERFSVRWSAYISAPASDYDLVVQLGDPGDTFRLFVDGEQRYEKTTASPANSIEIPEQFIPGDIVLLELEFLHDSDDSSLALYWKTATSGLEPVSFEVAYPANIFDDFVETVARFHRAALPLTILDIIPKELNHFIRFSENFADIDFFAMQPHQLHRLVEYCTLRDALPSSPTLLIDLFSYVNQPDETISLDDTLEILHLVTGWDMQSIDYLVNEHFSLGLDDFRNEIAVGWLYQVQQLGKRSGCLVQSLAELGNIRSDFGFLEENSRRIRKIVKAKLGDEGWLAAATSLNDKLRDSRRQALIDYLLAHVFSDRGIRDADGLYEYFLIDVQMGTCMDTSRIVQANAAVQQFIQRCLLNLESDIVGGQETGVSPDQLDKKYWEWMKNYRVWEANRKIFLYPENWLEPEWRRDKSELFRELETYLSENDITEKNVEQAFRKYLMGLNSVSLPEVTATFQQKDSSGAPTLLHVFARTRNVPYTYYYRTCDTFERWSAWQKMDLDVRSVEDGEHSGVHLLPVVWKNRLFLFWTEFVEASKSKSGTMAKSAESMSTEKLSKHEAEKYWNVHLAWSDFQDGKWSPKQLSNSTARMYRFRDKERESDIRLVADFDGDGNLVITMHYHIDSVAVFRNFWVNEVEFRLTDIAAKIEVNYPNKLDTVFSANQWKDYRLSFMGYSGDSPLRLSNTEYLAKEKKHQVHITPTRGNYLQESKEPFFYSDDKRTYFVRQRSNYSISGLKDPASITTLLTGTLLSLESVEAESSPLENIAMTDIQARPEAFGRLFSGKKKLADRDFALSLKPGYSGGSLLGSGIFGEMGGAMYIGNAFGGMTGSQFTSIASWLSALDFQSSSWLEFQTFYHPRSNSFVERLNSGADRKSGLLRLMQSDIESEDDGGTTFQESYQPVFTGGLVRPSTGGQGLKEGTYYKENVCFDVKGANSQYNWELFFHAPLYIATRLSKNGKYREAMQWFHYVFDPTTDEKPLPGKEISRYWQVLPFKTEPQESLEEWFRKALFSQDARDAINSVIADWRTNPFDPHRVAGNRPIAYMKHVVIKYVENLINWGDSLFRQFSRESVNEALQIYVIANHILGPRPQFVPKRGKIRPESFNTLRGKWDDFSNALVEMENIFPYSSEVAAVADEPGPNMLGAGSAFYFCIPPNDKLLEYWDTVEDRLFKIRHCQDINGVERKLALLSPPIDPAMLVQAASQGMSIESVLAELSSPPPLYRFGYLLQKAQEFCSDVRTLGSALLSVLEKRDGEELGQMRTSHEVEMNVLMLGIKERQVQDARVYREGLLKARETAELRFRHFSSMLDEQVAEIPGIPRIDPRMTLESSLPRDTMIDEKVVDVNTSLVESDERGVKLIEQEMREQDGLRRASLMLTSHLASELVAGVLGLVPQFSVDGKPLGVGAGTGFGGRQLSWFANSLSKFFGIESQKASQSAGNNGRMAGYIRREQDWTLQTNLAAREIVQVDKQITGADIRIQVAEKELDNLRRQIEHSDEVYSFLSGKFTGLELYNWMKEQLFSVYRQSYNIAYEIAKKTENAYRYELGTDTANFIRYGQFEDAKQGLAAGEKLQLSLRQLEKAYLEENSREFELTKHVSLHSIDPLALIQLRETGRCFFSLPEELFDLDFPGHYFRRIKSVSLSLPCVVGPYTTVSCTLRLLKNSFRTTTALGTDGYPRNNEEGIFVDDERFVESVAPVRAIATSFGQNDDGVFELNFRDERYLPFEGAGAISDWCLELVHDPAFDGTEGSVDRAKLLRQFDYDTITDIVLHLHYTAREESGPFSSRVVNHLADHFSHSGSVSRMRMFSLRDEFPAQYHRFLHPDEPATENVLELDMNNGLFPQLDRGKTLNINTILVIAKSSEATDYSIVLSPPLADSSADGSHLMTLNRQEVFGGLHANGAGGRNVSALDIRISREETMAWQMMITRAGGGNLTADPPEIEDILLVLGYNWLME